jgi:hypothetical protein
MSVFDDFPRDIMHDICQYLIGNDADLKKYRSKKSVLLPYVHHPMAVKTFTIGTESHKLPYKLPYKLFTLTVNGPISNDIANLIRSIKSLRELYHNVSYNCKNINTRPQPAYSFTKLRTLVIIGDLDNTLPVLEGLFPRLTTLTIKDCNLSYDFIKFISQLPALRTLDLINCYLRNPDDSIPVLIKIPLRFLNIRLLHIKYEHQLMICKMPIKYICISEHHKYRLIKLFNDPKVNEQFTAHIMMTHPD